MKGLCKSVAYFSIKLFELLLLICKSFLYNLDVNPVLGICLENIPATVICAFLFFKCRIVNRSLIKSEVAILSLITSAFVALLQQTLGVPCGVEDGSER